MQEYRLPGTCLTCPAAYDVIVTAVFQPKLLAQRIGRQDIVAREHVSMCYARTRECALYIFHARIDSNDLPCAPLTVESLIRSSEIKMRVQGSLHKAVTGTDQSKRTRLE